MDYVVLAPDSIVETEINLPLSKSESARRLILDAFAGITDENLVVADCDDTDALRRGLAVRQGEVNIGAAGTAMRFLTAFYAATPGTDVVLDGSERMRHRPIAFLVDALRDYGADIEYVGEQGFAPLHIRGRQLSGGLIDIDGSVSSQFISALLMCAPSMQDRTVIRLVGDVTSLPYLKMTVAMMQRRGIDVDFTGNEICVHPGSYGVDREPVSPDWSAASYWYAVTALTAGWVTLPGLQARSLQGDNAIAKLGEQFGVVTEFTDGGAELSASPEQYSRITLDMSETPDIVQTLVMVAAMLGIPFHFSGVHTLRNKETDRLAALCNEARKYGFVFTVEGDDTIWWEGARCPAARIPVIETYDDHRMAMAFAPTAALSQGIIIRNAEVVSKSYPGYWDDLRTAGFRVIDVKDLQPKE
jgi:3-phosphoshikimate 1-carboxyvinyltransferase